MGWCHDLTLGGAYGVYTDKRSKVIKGVKKILKAKNCEKYSKNQKNSPIKQQDDVISTHALLVVGVFRVLTVWGSKVI